uniref:G-protein coupled receptor n=1 Tax=Sipha flava TaxID=143950 RepID=A0A2S2QEW5_9HEMI
MCRRTAFAWPTALLLLLGLSFAATDDKCPMNLSQPAPEGARVEDGLLHAGQPERTYEPFQYRATTDGDGYRLCTCELKQCLVKCCEPGEAFIENKCTPFDELRGDIRVPKGIIGNKTAEASEAHDINQFHMLYQMPQCDQMYSLFPYHENDDSFEISLNGQLLQEANIDTYDHFCFELMQFDSGFQYVAIVCSPNNNNSSNGLKPIINGALIISIPFLFMTLLVYAFTKKLRDLHGKCIIGHVLSLLIAYISIIIGKLKTIGIDDKVCVIIAYITQFFTLASFFWLNLMCFDLWYIFRYGKKLKNEPKMIKIYCLYAWGCSSLISIVTYVADKWPKLMTFLPTPKIGGFNCGISDSEKAVDMYFYGPIGVILFVNALVFIHIALHIALYMGKRPESYRNLINYKKKMILCLELFTVMGLNWTAEIISWKFPDKLQSVWFITDVGNALQGVLIFVIFVCRKRVLKMFNLQCCPRLRLFESSSPAPRQPNPVNDVTSNPTVICQLLDINPTNENQKINQQNPNSHLLNSCNSE